MKLQTRILKQKLELDISAFQAVVVAAVIVILLGLPIAVYENYLDKPQVQTTEGQVAGAQIGPEKEIASTATFMIGVLFFIISIGVISSLILDEKHPTDIKS